MAYSPIALVAPNYRDYKNEWLKAYEPGTTTPKIIALDSGATITVAKVQLNADGFLKSASGTLVIPYIDGSYDLWLFPTEAEADANDTINAEKLADNILPLNQDDNINDLSLPYVFDTVAAMVGSAIVPIVGKLILIKDESIYLSVLTSGVTPNDRNIKTSTVNATISFSLVVSDKAIVRRFGADSLGIKAADDFSVAENTTMQFQYGNYISENANLVTIENATLDEGAVIGNSIYSPTVYSDSGKNWLHQNHLEEEYISTTTEAITSGNIPYAPRFMGPKQSNFNVLAHWYQDFGLEAVRTGGGAGAGAEGWLGWYYWAWLFHGSSGDGYEAKRHPWLGFYRGDDPKVLDWMCYWMCEAGVTGIIPSQRGTYTNIRTGWATPSNLNHWFYQLLTNTPNFKSMQYSMWADSRSAAPAASTDVEASFDEVVSFYAEYDNFSYITRNGLIYPIVYAFEAAQWRGVYDNFSGDSGMRQFLKDQATKFKNQGFGGFCLLGRNPYGPFIGDEDLIAAGCIYMKAFYGENNYNPASNGGKDPAVTYGDLAVGISPDTAGSTHDPKYVVPTIYTDKDSHSTHPGTFSFTGSTPELFNVLTRNLIKRASSKGHPEIITIYNVSEWAEGGAALQPNVRDGKGYLNSLADAINDSQLDINDDNRYQRQYRQFLSGPSVPCSVEMGSTTVLVFGSFGWTSTATPFIVDPLKYNGKRIRIGIHPSQSGSMTLSDNGTLAGSGLLLNATGVTLNDNDSIEFEYDLEQDIWIQIGSVINIL
jgi:hypothetical protein